MSSINQPQRPLVSVILAAGRGTRMRLPGTHKVAVSLQGRPVIARALETYARCGALAHLVIVGEMAEQVMRAAAGAPGETVFIRQPEPRGTGNAARCAADALRAMGYGGDVLVAAGDKVMDSAAPRRLLAAFRESGADMAFLTGCAEDHPGAGRVVLDAQGRPRAIAEVLDIARAGVLGDLRCAVKNGPAPSEAALRTVLSAFGDEDKAAKALGPLWALLCRGGILTREHIESLAPGGSDIAAASGLALSTDDAAAARDVNLSVYAFRAPALYEAVDHLGADNAQGEEYLTDTVAILAARGRRIITVPTQHRDEVMAYNTPEELERVDRAFAACRVDATSSSSKRVRPVSRWLNALDTAAADAMLTRLSGGDPGARERKRELLRRALQAHAERFGDEPVRVARAPGRLNIMGRHIDHQGGTCNLMAIEPNAFAVLGERVDGRVHLHNADARAYPDRSFAIVEATAGFAGQAWLDFVNGECVARAVREYAGDWSLYARAIVARVQALAETDLGGFNATLSSDIPVAAGLSSSSALIVALAEGLVHLAGLDMERARLVEMCGEAEWYAGTRGGAGDHAAMVFGRHGHIVAFSSMPYRVERCEALPEGAVYLVCDSHTKARKTAGARDVFNHRVACYHLAREWLSMARPDLSPVIQHLRDINPRALGLSLAELVDLLWELPESISRDVLRSRLPEGVVDRWFATHSETVGPYPLRAVALYGVAECARAAGTADLLAEGDLVTLGRWMAASHDGDRVARHDVFGNGRPFTAAHDDPAMARWRDGAERDVPAARLEIQSGGYSCSTAELDRMVDAAIGVPGVLGAQVSGAGLGGCMMVLVAREAVAAARDALIGAYYEPAGLEPRITACTPVEGSGLLAL